MAEKKHNRIFIKNLAESLTSKREEQKALAKYGYHQNSAIFCKKYLKWLIPFLLVAATVFIAFILPVVLIMLIFPESFVEILSLFYIIFPIASLILPEIFVFFEIFLFYYQFRIMGSFDLFGSCEERTIKEKYTEVTITHSYGNNYDVDVKPNQYRYYDNDKFGFLLTPIIWLLLFLTCPVWSAFYYIWVRTASAKMCKRKCSEELFENFDKSLKETIKFA